MRQLRPVLFATLATLALAGTALASGEGGTMKEHSMMMMGPNGQMTTVMMNDKMMSDEAIMNAKPMPGNQIVFMKDGKMYVVQDSKMPDGTMWSHHMGMTP